MTYQEKVHKLDVAYQVAKTEKERQRILRLFAKLRRSRKANPTKSQRRAKASRAAKQRGIIKAVKGLLKKTNPSAKITGARVVKLRDGVLKITPIRANRGRR